MPSLLVTGAVGGYLGLLLTCLSLPVGLYRNDHNIMHGDGRDPSGKHKEFINKIRAHANAAEYIPTFILMLGLLEFNEVLPQKMLIIMGYAYALFRTMHSVQLQYPKVVPVVFRQIGFIGGILLMTLMCGRLVSECGPQLAQVFFEPAAGAGAAASKPVMEADVNDFIVE